LDDGLSASQFKVSEVHFLPDSFYYFISVSLKACYMVIFCRAKHNVKPNLLKLYTPQSIPLKITGKSCVA